MEKMDLTAKNSSTNMRWTTVKLLDKNKKASDRFEQWKSLVLWGSIPFI